MHYLTMYAVKPAKELDARKRALLALANLPGVDVDAAGLVVDHLEAGAVWPVRMLVPDHGPAAALLRDAFLTESDRTLSLEALRHRAALRSALMDARIEA